MAVTKIASSVRRWHCLLFTLSCSGMYLIAGFEPASAVTIAADNASNSAYELNLAGAWSGLNATSEENPDGMDNGGFGFQPWNFDGGFHKANRSPYGELNHFIDGTDFPTSTFNDLGGPAFGLTNANRAFFGYTSRATRTFAPLEIGDTLSFDFDNPLLQPLDEADFAGFIIRLNAGGGPILDSPLLGVTERFGLSTTSSFNGNRWSVKDSRGLADTGVADADTSLGANFRWTLTSESTYLVELVRLSDSLVLFSASGELANDGAGAIDTLEITLFGNGSGDGLNNTVTTGEREFFFNSLSIHSALPGDYDFDGEVNGVDFLKWQRGESFIPLSNSDLISWRENYGTSATSTAAVASVPEPGSTLLVVVIGLSHIAYGRKYVLDK